MSTTSPNFGLTLASSTDNVDVASHVANNFASLDTIISVVHTGSGQLKDGLSLVNPTLSGIITVTGTVNASRVVATTGSFQTITATGGALTINTLTVGTMAIPAAIGSSGQLLGVASGTLSFLAPSAASGPDLALSNLANVAINTNLNTFSAGFVTVNRIVATSGAISGVTAFAATTGTFSNLTVLTTAAIPTIIGTNATITNIVAGFVTATGVTVASATGTLLVATSLTASNLTIVATATIATARATTLIATNATATTATIVNLTATNMTIGTYSYPATVGSTGQILRVTTGNLVFASATGQALTTAYFRVYATGTGIRITTADLGGQIIPMDTKLFDVGNGFNTAASTYTVTASGYYKFGAVINITASSGKSVYTIAVSGSGGPHILGSVSRATADNIAANFIISGCVVLFASSGAVYTPYIYLSQAITGTAGAPIVDVYHTGTFYSYFWGMKIPDS